MQFSWMWDGSDAQRRWYARSGFYLFCMLPTLLVASWILFPSRHDHWERELAAILDMSVEIGHVSRKHRSQTRLSELKFSDPTLGMVATSKTFRSPNSPSEPSTRLTIRRSSGPRLNRLIPNEPRYVMQNVSTNHLKSSHDTSPCILIQKRTQRR